MFDIPTMVRLSVGPSRANLTGAAASSGASRAMRKAAQPCSAASARIGATLPQCQAARIVIRHPFNPAHTRSITGGSR